jgi:nanoRNase/pAp phosphatase (c-di-AMP/oligoRNAs hydrolase)
MVSERTATRLAELERHVSSSSGRWLVLTHDNPDPDAIAAAMALGKLLRQRMGRSVTVAYGGIVGRAENREMVRVLKLELSRWRHLNLKNYRHFALVDCQPQTGNSQLPAEIVPDLVFDHHPLRKQTGASPFVDVRTDYGATASILAEYVIAADLTVTQREATAFVYAIRSETLDFSREAAGPDHALYDRFLQAADKRLLGRIQNPRLPLSYFASLHDALEHLETIDSLILSHLGSISQPDIVPEIADLLLRMEGKTWSLCTGLYEDRIYCSIRTSNPRADASKVMRRMLGKRGKGGGHGMIAGGWTPQPPTPEAVRKRQAELGHRLASILRKRADRLVPLSLRPIGTTTDRTTEPAPAPEPAATVPEAAKAVP